MEKPPNGAGQVIPARRIAPRIGANARMPARMRK